MHVANEFYFIESIKGKTNYALLTLEAEVSARPATRPGDLLLMFSRDDAYNEPVRFGARYFFDHYASLHAVDLFVNILRVNSMPMDTTSTTVFYATVRALSEALAFQIEDFVLNKETGILSMPFPI